MTAGRKDRREVAEWGPCCFESTPLNSMSGLPSTFRSRVGRADHVPEQPFRWPFLSILRGDDAISIVLERCAGAKRRCVKTLPDGARLTTRHRRAPVIHANHFFIHLSSRLNAIAKLAIGKPLQHVRHFLPLNFQTMAREREL